MGCICLDQGAEEHRGPRVKPDEREKKMNLTADEFNEKFPVGTPVTYCPRSQDARGVLRLSTRTITPARELGDGTPVVGLGGREGARSLTHIELRAAPAAVETGGPEDFMATLDRITAAREEAESIRCPHCQHVQDLEELADYDELVTLWGDNNGPAVTEVECEECSEAFLVREQVSRTFDTAKMDEDFE